MDISRQALFGKLNTTLFRSIESATTFCKLRGNPYVELVHWVHQLMQENDGDVIRILRHYEADIAKIEQDISRNLLLLPSGASSISDFSHHIDLAIERAWVYATLTFKDYKIRGAWLFAALVLTPELRRVLTGVSGEFTKIPQEELAESLPEIIKQSPESQDRPYDDAGYAAAIPGEASQSLMDNSQDSKSALARYCTDLTEEAKQGRIDPVIGREHEIRTMIDILLRRRQNNPLLTGEAGVGKTAVVEGFALAIAHGEVPPSLSEVRLLSLDVGALLAGASMKGEFESRLKSVLEEASHSANPIIIFVDEVHTLVGAGGTSGTGDAANLLKPALARGTLRTIGATTWSEYKRHIEKDPALTRRFQVLQVAEPEEAAAINMVRGLVSTFENHHGVIVMDEAVRAAVKLSHRYIPSRQLPDKAISLLDTACARVGLSLHTPPSTVQYLRQQLSAAQTELDLLSKQQRIGLFTGELTEVELRIEALSVELETEEARWQQELQAVDKLIAARACCQNNDDKALLEQLSEIETALRALQGDVPVVFPEVSERVVAAIVSDWTGIPVGRMVKDEVGAVLNLSVNLAQRVVGQDDALDQIGERIQTARCGLTDPNKPVGVFLLVGPSGVGKTETALALSEAMYGGEQNLITINMSEFQEAHTVSTLKGAPPGYVGYGEGGVLTEAVRRRPYSVVLLDEIEKAHRDVHEIFYQVFDKGMMEDGEGLNIDFKNTVILMTSNVGSDLVSQLYDDPALAPDWSTLKEVLMPELRKHFPAAFIGRLTIIPYLPLADEALSSIARLHLNRIVLRMREQHGIALNYDEALVEHIVQHCPMHETGARLLIGYIEQHILPALSRYWLQALTEKKAVESINISIDPSHTENPIIFSVVPV
ncbi:type VI secretion system ATPase TssH [Snodgrassella alvi]|uniref:type VI secretion system ATPase TssH n=1 Tax=Snodgrassella alvi TaxID=1196083 RepID=UPI00351A4A3B